MKRILVVLLTISIIGCNQKKKEKKTAPEVTETKDAIPVEPNGGIGDGALSISDHFIKSIEKAHKKDKFLDHKAVSFYIKIIFNGKEHLEGKVTMLTNSSKIRIDKKDESKLIYDGEKVYLCPADANDKGARFDMFTWTYFFGLPYKLSDPGTKWEMQDDRTLNNTIHSTAKLTFEAGTGDAPDDWYVIYADPVVKSLQAAAYIVTFGSDGDTSKAEADPHAIHYKDFTTIDSIPFATKWEFYGWTSEKGMTDKLGEATISDITFLENEGKLFDDPENSKIID
ncbi:hypothetical protein D1815_22795 [Aquimarina sp. AD1]|uniref:DUF6503 family protein n=1 Tax=Aquimarina sp. (strain AD1) TaxID=1714848 RepID=UPI000E51B3B7|nr:DUF6503 family protein [Aquimarina sp. AD1]AXT58446.1 hypothetical protein D1815_22795 [Aquimarina sp. AD1]RKN16806.1 hypothetical protein D7035_15360 [Aquimarina sp. AD1]